MEVAFSPIDRTVSIEVEFGVFADLPGATYDIPQNDISRSEFFLNSMIIMNAYTVGVITRVVSDYLKCIHRATNRLVMLILMIVYLHTHTGSRNNS